MFITGDFGYIYLLVDTGKPGGVFKIGRTKRDPSDRLNEYPKGSYFLQVFKCSDHIDAESDLIRAMKTRFAVFSGREYFRGGKDDLLDVFQKICRSTPRPMEID